MNHRPAKIRLALQSLLVMLCALLSPTVSAQETKPAQEQADVIRVSTELVQTDVMVFDKDGHFVDGLKPEQFLLKIDNKPTAISFFERVTAGKVEPNSNTNSNSSTSATTPDAPSNIVSIIRGRTVIFFVDDLHLGPDGLSRTRKALLGFIDNGMADNDQVAIVSSSGQIGFLQQFTADRFALRSAVARLNFRGQPNRQDMFRPPMSEYTAMKIRDGDSSAVSYYVSEMMKQECSKAEGGGSTCNMSISAMRQLVVDRARQIGLQTTPDTFNTLALLQGLMKSIAQLPGRKLMFLISDGFYLDEHTGASREKLRKITDAAGRAGVIIYTLDARGIISENIDVTNQNRLADGAGFMIGTTHEYIAASQDGLNALAGDTGGRALRNTNAPMAEFVDKVLDETSNYYLLAWRPDSEEQKRGKFNHIEGSIIGRPDLKVRLRSSYFKSAPLPVLTTKKKSEKDPLKAREDDMRLVIDAPVAQTQIPTKLNLRIGQMPGVGTQVAATIEINRELLSFDLKDGKQAADIDIGGIFYDDKGKPVNSFVGRLRVFPVPGDAPAEKGKNAIYGFRAWLPPGLYQVRVGIRDVSSGRLGSAMEFIEIPKLK
jgi:VWFA-related protein